MRSKGNPARSLEAFPARESMWDIGGSIVHRLKSASRTRPSQVLHSQFSHTHENSFKRLHEAAYEPVEILVGLSPIVDLADGMNDGGMVLPAEELPDGWEGAFRELLAKIH